MIRIELFWGHNISHSWGLKSMANVHLLYWLVMWLHISSLRMSPADRYYQILLSVLTCMIFIEHIYHLEGTYRIPLDSTLDICPLVYYSFAGIITSNWWLSKYSSVVQLHGFWDPKVQLELWLSLENRCTANLCGNGALVPFEPDHLGSCVKQYDITRDLNMRCYRIDFAAV